MHRAGALLLILAGAWLPGQARAGELRLWIAQAALPLLVLLWVPELAPRRTWLRLLPWGLLVFGTLLQAPAQPAPGAALAVLLVQLGWLGAGLLGLGAAAQPPSPAPVRRGAGWAAAAGAVAAGPGLAFAGGTFGNADLLAGFLALTLLWTLPLVVSGDRATDDGRQRAWSPLRWLGLVALGLQAAALVVSQSLGAWLAVAVGGWAWWAVGRWRWPQPAESKVPYIRKALVLFVMPLLVLAASLLSPMVQEHLAARGYLYRVGLTVAGTALPWGVGPGRFHGSFLDAQAALAAREPATLDHWTNAEHAHSEAGQLLAEQGPLGLLLGLLPFALLVLRPRAHPAWAAGVAGLVLAQLSLPLYEPATAFLLAFSVGWALGDPATSPRAASAPAAPCEWRRAVSWPGLWRPLGLALALIALLLGTAELLASRLLVRGVAAGAVEPVALAAELSLRPARARRHQATLLLDPDPARALVVAREAVRLDPSPAALVLEGQAAMRLRAPHLALPPLQAAVRLAPRAFAAHFDLARAYEEAGDRFQARRHATRARSLRPTDPRLRWLPE